MNEDDRTQGSQPADLVGGLPAEQLPEGLTVDDLREFEQATAQLHAVQAKVVGLAEQISKSMGCRRAEGMSGDDFLNLVGRLPGKDRSATVTTGAMLSRMPHTEKLFDQGRLGWGETREIAYTVRNLNAAEREEVDEFIHTLITEAAAEGALLGPDQVIEQVQYLADRLRCERYQPTNHDDEDDESPVDPLAGTTESFLARQPDFAGGMRLFGELTATDAAVLNQALKEYGGALPAGAKSDPVAVTANKQPAWSNPTSAKHNAAALMAVCAQALAGGDGNPAKPLMVVHADVAQLAGCETERAVLGLVRTGLRGPLAKIGAATLKALAEDADVKAVLFDQARPLAVTSKLNANNIPAVTRFAVAARDMGDRWPASQAPLEHCDQHHIRERRNGGIHDPDNLISTGRSPHVGIHAHDWDVTLDGDTGVATFTRGGRKFQSLPRGRIHRPPPRGQPPDGGRETSTDGHDPPRAGPDPPRGDHQPEEPDQIYYDRNGNQLPF